MPKLDRRCLRRVMAVLLAITVLMPLSAAVAHDDENPLSNAMLRGLVPPLGFVSHPWAAVPAPTALEWGPDGRLYVLSLTGQVFAFVPAPDGQSRRLGIPLFYSTPIGPPTGVPIPFYGFDGVATANGIATDPFDPQTIYVSQFYSEGDDTWGRVVAVRDTGGNGIGDADEIVIDRLPGGQHWVNDMVVNPADGRLYITNGNRTDNGIECSSDPCAPETDRPDYPWRAGAVLRVDRDARGLTPHSAAVEVVAEGMRNIYDLAFWPPDPTIAFMATNGPQDPAGDDVLYATDVTKKADMGFPSCLISPHPRGNVVEELLAEILGEGGHHDHGMGLEPQDNLNPAVIDRFGPCDPTEVLWPVASFGGHVSANGLAFSHGSEFPGTYGNDLFVALWGSLEPSHPLAGHKIVRVNLRDDGTVANDEHGRPWVQEFATGGLPLDVSFGPDGAMYVADMAGVIHRIARVDGFVPPNDEHYGHHHGDDHGDHGHDHGNVSHHGHDETCDPGSAPAGPAKGKGKSQGQAKGQGQGNGQAGDGGDCDGHDHGFDYRTVDPDSYATPDHPAYGYDVGEFRHHDVTFRRLWGCDVDHPYFAWLVDEVDNHISTKTPDIRAALLNGYIPMSPVPNDFGYPDTYWHWWHLGYGPESHPERDDPSSFAYRDAIVQPHNWIEYLLMVPEHVAYPHRESLSWVVEGVMFAIPHDGPGPNLYGPIEGVQEHPCNPFHEHADSIDNPHFHIWPRHHVHPLAMNPAHLCDSHAEMKESPWLWRDTWHCVYDGDRNDPDIGHHDPDNPWGDGGGHHGHDH